MSNRILFGKTSALLGNIPLERGLVTGFVVEYTGFVGVYFFSTYFSFFPLIFLGYQVFTDSHVAQTVPFIVSFNYLTLASIFKHKSSPPLSMGIFPVCVCACVGDVCISVCVFLSLELIYLCKRR